MASMFSAAVRAASSLRGYSANAPPGLPVIRYLPWYDLLYSRQVVCQEHRGQRSTSALRRPCAIRLSQAGHAARPAVRLRRLNKAQAACVERARDLVDQISVQDALPLAFIQPPDEFAGHASRPLDRCVPGHSNVAWQIGRAATSELPALAERYTVQWL